LITPSATPTVTFTPSDTPEVVEPYQVVFYGNRNGNDDIYLMTLNGVERALTSGTANEREPFCSPDGSVVVYASDETGSYQLYQLTLSSTTPVQLTDSEGMNFAPAYSPDGSTIAFVSTRNQGIPTIWMMNADGTGQHQITTDLGRDTSPFWGPDSRQLLFASEQNGPWDIFMTVTGEEDVLGEFPILPPENSEGNELWPFFDSQGERIVYTSWENLEDPQTADIYLLDFEQPAPVAVRAKPGADFAWAWGDETHLLASIGGPDDIQIALVDITTGEAVPLTNAGTFNGGARLCTVQPSILPPEPTPAPSLTPTSTLAPPEVSPTPSLTPDASVRLTSNELLPAPKVQLMPVALDQPAPAAPRSPIFALLQGRVHVVQQGQTLMRIGNLYGISWQLIARANRLVNPDRLKIGQTLMIPATWSDYLKLDPDYVDTRPVKRIVVHLEDQRVDAYENGRLVRSVMVSTGLPKTPTVQGEFRIYQKLISQTMTGPGYYLPGVPYVMYFYQGYGLHGTYWHKNFGRPMSHGCVNLPTLEAEWFYSWAEIGTIVKVVG
jgi:LysM repeat protein